jgi:hypothetical protein
MVDSATSWLEMVEMPVVQCSVTSAAIDSKGHCERAALSVVNTSLIYGDYMLLALCGRV